MNIQYSRGCPLTANSATSPSSSAETPHQEREQIIAELDPLYDRGWKGGVFFVDDNFIGKKEKLKSEILPAMIGWMENDTPSFYTEASINLADDA